VEPVPEFAKFVQQHLRRTEWDDFPDVIIHAEESLVKKHPLYAPAKGGDVKAAEGLALEVTTIGALDKISALIGAKRPHLLAVHALETEGANAIPRTFARILSKMLDLPIAKGVIQINRVVHTGADGYRRLALPALFDGEVKESEYFLVDDFVGQGGTLANLRGLVESRGAKVLGATSLTGKGYSAKLRLTEETLQGLKGKHGTELEQWWVAAFGYGFERLTESEARYLTRADDAHSISARIAAAARK
jgi:hypoxanthine-guanine phosphoribosyltransferase